MSKRQSLFVLALCALGLVGGVPGPADAEWHRIADPTVEIRPLERECRPRIMRPEPCHIHRPETFKRLPKNDPALWDPHARQEYLEHMRARDKVRAR